MNYRLRELRKLKNLSQKEFGEKINISQSQIASYENGARNIPNRVIKDISKVYRVNESWLIAGEGDMFIDIIDELDIDDPELRELACLYEKLDDSMKKNIMDTLRLLTK
ncbi:helix-turn-helix domain-containing protein [Romboutsia sp. Marseille-P6047]|uniref:helix-turn-helix domain-containing protein n=1 Tax=Romboutsia sp. Marseille-P6047 TaxID=2161817 RepID=UPI000F05822B|nr:helix-turn-helix transcriptional regulator [Romboutsia sp. Marseille-P6047]